MTPLLYYGLGSTTPGTNYTTCDNRHTRIDIILTRAYQANFSLAAGLLIAGNSFSNIKQGADPLTQNIQDICSKYYAGSVGLTFDNRNNSMDPRGGNYVLTDFDFGIAALGSPAKYEKLTLDLEYRFPIYWVFSGAVFYEAGKVAPLLTDIGLNDWASDIGAGLRINFGNVIVRGDFGRGSEGTNAYFFYNQSF